MSNTRNLLANRSVVAISGEDSKEFLQGLITNDINKVSKDNAVFAALLSPQGKFLYDFFIVEHEGRFLLDIARETQADLIKRLTMYKLRSKVDIAILPEMEVGWSDELQVTSYKLQGSVKYNDPRYPELGIRAIGIGFEIQGMGEYDKQRLSLGIPEGGRDLETNAAFPMQWGYDKLNAIDFNKGCYVGQEVTARSKHIGTIRKMVHQVQADVVLPAIGTPVMADEKEVGKMASSIGNTGLALLNIEVVAGGAKLYSNGTEIQANIPIWALR